ncbi:hypothetical protein CR513_39539, partial [Mucuna pruriens]
MLTWMTTSTFPINNSKQPQPRARREVVECTEEASKGNWVDIGRPSWNKSLHLLNPTTLDVVKKELTRLLAARIIYPISEIQWISLVQVIPKKSRMTVTMNRHDEMEAQLGNSQGSLSSAFIDQVLEKLPEKSHYCFLDGFSRYMQIHIAPSA